MTVDRRPRKTYRLQGLELRLTAYDDHGLKTSCWQDRLLSKGRASNLSNTWDRQSLNEDF
jgi:hypothetical protein